VLFAEFLLRIAHVGLGLVGHGGPGCADLTLHGGHRLTGDFAHRTGNAGDLRTGGCRAAELLDPSRHLSLVVFGLGQVLAQALLVRLLVGQRDVGREVSF
jgi:hypothetical protein